MLSEFIHWHLAWLAPILKFVFIHFITEPLRWYIYIRLPSALRFSELFCIFSLTAMISYLFPLKLGLPVRMWLLTRAKRMRFSFVAGVMAMDGVIFTLCWGAAALVGMICLAMHIHLIPIIIGMLMFTALLYLLGPGKRLLQEKLSQKWGQALEFMHHIRLPLLAAAAGVILFDIASQMLRHIALAELVGMQLPWTRILAAAAVAFFIGLASTLPLGLGAYDATLIGLLAGMGAPAEQGIAMVVINRFVSLLVSLAVGVPSAWKLGINSRKLREIIKSASGKFRGSG